MIKDQAVSEEVLLTTAQKDVLSEQGIESIDHPQEEPVYVKSLLERTDKINETPEDVNKIILGKTKAMVPVYWDPAKNANNHIAIAGGSGEGKSQLTKTLIMRRLFMPDKPRIHVIDIHKEYVNDVVQAAIDHGIDEDDVVVVDVTKTGFPFRLLERIGELPDDIRVENILVDLRSSNPQLGNIQSDRVRKLLVNGLIEDLDNLELRDRLEALDDPNLKAQLSAVMLLLRSSSNYMTKLLEKRLVIHSLCDYQDPISRAAYSVCFLSQLMQRQLVLKQQEELHNHSPLCITFEEAPLLYKAGIQMQRFFQESRKLKCEGYFISQKWSDVPKFVSRNSDTHVLFRSAARDETSLRNVELPSNPGEAIIRIGDDTTLARVDRFFENYDLRDNKKQVCVLGVADNARIKAQRVQNDEYLQRKLKRDDQYVVTSGHDYIHPKSDINIIQRLLDTNGRQPDIHKSWIRCLWFSFGDNENLLWDEVSGLPLLGLDPVRFLLPWKDLNEHLSEVMNFKYGTTGMNGTVETLLEKGIAVSRDGRVVLSSLLSRIPTVSIEGTASERPDEWPEPQIRPVNKDTFDKIRATVGGLWGRNIIEMPRELYLPVYRVLHEKRNDVYPAWRKLTPFSIIKKLPENIPQWA